MPLEYSFKNNQVIDAESGEILGEAIVNASINGLDSLEAVMQKRMEIEASVLAQESILNQMIANQQAIVKKKRAYLDYYDGIHMPIIEKFARSFLDGKSVRSIQLLCGKIQFRKQASKVEIADKKLAVHIAKSLGFFDAVKVEESLLKSALTEEELAKCVEADSNVFQFVPESDKMTITGLGGK